MKEKTIKIHLPYLKRILDWDECPTVAKNEKIVQKIMIREVAVLHNKLNFFLKFFLQSPDRSKKFQKTLRQIVWLPFWIVLFYGFYSTICTLLVRQVLWVAKRAKVLAKNLCEQKKQTKKMQWYKPYMPYISLQIINQKGVIFFLM